MATLKVEANGNAPSNAKTGDHIVTAGGTYEVLDSSAYKGMDATQLANAGVGYNPSSGLYSRKISDVSANVGKAQGTIPQVSLRTSDTARQWANQQNQKVSADLDSAYYQNRQDAYNTYMDSITRQNQQANDVNQAYLDNISKLYDDTYYNNQAAIQRASSRGLASSGLGNAMQVAALADASKQNAQLRAQRNRDLNNIEAEMNNLTNQYNVNLDTLAKKLRSDKASALSQNEIAFLQAVMEMEEYNANVENSMLATQQEQAFNAEQSMLQREYEASQKALDRQLEMDMLLKQLEAQSFSGGYGYGGRGGYSRGYRGYRNYGSGSSGSSGSALRNSVASTSAGASAMSDALNSIGAPFGPINASNAQAQLDEAQRTFKTKEVAQMRQNIDKKQQQKKKAQTQKKNTTSSLRYNPGESVKKTAVKSTKKGTNATTKKVKK